MKIYVVRHGETDWNTEMRLQGRTDIPLNAQGMEEAEKTLRRVKSLLKQREQALSGFVNNVDETMAKLIVAMTEEQKEQSKIRMEKDIEEAKKEVEKAKEEVKKANEEVERRKEKRRK